MHVRIFKFFHDNDIEGLLTHMFLAFINERVLWHLFPPITASFVSGLAVAGIGGPGN